MEAHWLQHNECDAVVKEAWMTDVVGVPLDPVAQKISYTRIKLDAWQKVVFCGRQMEMMRIRSRLEELLDKSLTDQVVEEKKTLGGRLQVLLSQEETFWRQRAKVTWLRDGDQNTSFFHRKASNRKRKNTIKGLYHVNGVWVEEYEEVAQVVSNYFQHMFTAENIDMEAMHTILAASFITLCYSQYE